MDELRQLLEELLRAASDRGAHNVHILASVARVQASAIRYFDFLVEMDQDRTPLDAEAALLVSKISSIISLLSPD